MIGDTLGYDRCCHVSTANDDLWVSDSRFGVHPVSGSPGDDLLDGRGAAEVDGPLLPTRECAIDLPPFRYIAANLLPLETPVRPL